MSVYCRVVYLLFLSQRLSQYHWCNFGDRSYHSITPLRHDSFISVCQFSTCEQFFVILVTEVVASEKIFPFMFHTYMLCLLLDCLLDIAPTLQLRGGLGKQGKQPQIAPRCAPKILVRNAMRPLPCSTTFSFLGRRERPSHPHRRLRLPTQIRPAHPHQRRY